jgi:hypothetical protein
MTSPFWSEWDGRGIPEAVAWTAGWTEDVDEAIASVRRLGVQAREIALHYGWSGSVDGDEVLDACTEDGETLDTEGLFVASDSIVKTTFASVVVQ